MLYKEIIHTKHINTLCGQNVEFFNVKPSDKCNKQKALTV